MVMLSDNGNSSQSKRGWYISVTGAKAYESGEDEEEASHDDDESMEDETKFGSS
jgi:hypothetical protein